MARVSLHPIREYGGEIFTDYYFGEANTANKSDKLHNNAINENLNWGGISGLLQLATTNSGSRPEIQDDPEGRGGRAAGDDEELNTTNSDSTSRRRRASDEKLPQENDNVKRRGHQDIQRRNDNSNRRSNRSIITQSVRTLSKRTGVNRMTKMLTEVRRTKCTTGIPKPEIGIETILRKQSIVTILNSTHSRY